MNLGAVPSDGGVSFAVWAPEPEALELFIRDELGERVVTPARDESGYWTHFEPAAGPGARYGYIIDGNGPYPDPCSRSQPEGVHGLSEVVPAGHPEPEDSHWDPPAFEDLVIYELHIGTFTAGGTFASAVAELDRLAGIGINALEVMPVASFPGRWNWGYDGVAIWAPFHGYGGPPGLREFVEAAHARGIAVILDVVYNHFGPDGNYTGLYSRQYYRPDRHTPWGDALNFDGPGSAEVRRFFIANALHWLQEYGIDGLRLDATHTILDDSEPHFLAQLSATLRKSVSRPIYLIAETHENDPRYVRAIEDGGFGFDAVWADDFHHAARTAVASDREGYFAGFDGLESLAHIAPRGWLYEGQSDPGYGAPRGKPCEIDRWGNLVYCLQNHDQVGNRAFGERVSRTAGEPAVKALTALLLLLPATPMLFQGQEFGSARPFLFFTDHSEQLAPAVRDGRRAEFARFSAFSDPGLRERIPDPQSPQTFLWSRLEPPEERDPRSQLVEDFHRTLIDLRRSDPVLRRFREQRLPVEAATAPGILTVRFRAGEQERLLALNLRESPGEVALPREGSWRCVLNSDEPRFGGGGGRVALGNATITLPARSAVLLGF